MKTHMRSANRQLCVFLDWLDKTDWSLVEISREPTATCVNTSSWRKFPQILYIKACWIKKADRVLYIRGYNICSHHRKLSTRIHKSRGFTPFIMPTICYHHFQTTEKYTFGIYTIIFEIISLYHRRYYDCLSTCIPYCNFRVWSNSLLLFSKLNLSVSLK